MRQRRGKCDGVSVRLKGGAILTPSLKGQLWSCRCVVFTFFPHSFYTPRFCQLNLRRQLQNVCLQTFLWRQMTTSGSSTLNHKCTLLFSPSRFKNQNIVSLLCYYHLLLLVVSELVNAEHFVINTSYIHLSQYTSVDNWKKCFWLLSTLTDIW